MRRPLRDAAEFREVFLQFSQFFELAFEPTERQFHGIDRVGVFVKGSELLSCVLFDSFCETIDSGLQLFGSQLASFVSQICKQRMFRKRVGQ